MTEDNILDIEKEDNKNNFTKLIVLEDVKQNHHYEILEIRENYAKVLLKAGQGEVIDNQTTLFDGEVFAAAAFSVLASVNMKNTTILDSQVEFFKTISIEDNVIFEAFATSSLSSKRHANVKAYVNDILILEGDFSTIRLDSKSKILE